MEAYEKNIIPKIESVYNTLTPIELTIADFFMRNTQKMDFSSKTVSRLLFVSEASLSRFSKKCGFRGYREFIFQYEESLDTVPDAVLTNSSSKQVLGTYQELLNKSYSLVDEQQMERICQLFSNQKRIYVYGIGHSGLAGQEMKLRFMRIGVNIACITDIHVIKMNTVLLDKHCVVLGISVSGETQEVLQGLRAAKAVGATTILMTSHNNGKLSKYCDEVLLLPVKEHLDNGKAISPQFPILIMIDILYSHFLKYDTPHKEALHNYTLNVLADMKLRENTRALKEPHIL